MKSNEFCQEKERDRSLGKQKLEYLLNVPFQQITSRIPASLKEIRSQTTALDPDFEPIGEAIEAIDKMLGTINENKKICAETEAIFKKIQGLPGHLLKAPRQFICAMEFLSIPNGTNAWICSIIELLLFKDCVLMTEKIDPGVSCPEFLRFKRAVRTLKFVEYCHLIRVRAVRILESANEGNMLVIVVRNHAKDDEWYLQTLCSVDSINEFVTKLVDEVFQATGRRISIDVGCPSELDEATLNESRFSSATSKVLRWVSLHRSRFMNRSITTAAAAFERNGVEKELKT
ncbi:Protein T2 [Parelaphostrongylus tenuis]|uniref:Protein T2 n=1 Tax=Parelaphostrongylus tenuis TaxID=148309 RepID=A0AAD5MLK0_PARTN|nr:Protein T2 [Parelaphostrongylus tenuis]